MLLMKPSGKVVLRAVAAVIAVNPVGARRLKEGRQRRKGERSRKFCKKGLSGLIKVLELGFVIEDWDVGLLDEMKS
jgi:hypothetical protein